MSLRRSSRRAAAEANQVLTTKTPIKNTKKATKILLETTNESKEDLPVVNKTNSAIKVEQPVSTRSTRSKLPKVLQNIDENTQPVKSVECANTAKAVVVNVNSEEKPKQALALSPDSKDQSLSAPKDEVVIKVPVVTQIDDRTFQPIQPIDDTINDTLNDTVPFEEEELEDIMNNMSLLANVSQTEPDIEEVDNDVNHDNQLNQSISAAFSYRR